MDIKNPGDFIRFCAPQAGQRIFCDRIDFILNAADTAVFLNKINGGVDKRVPEHLEAAIRKRYELQDTELVRVHEPDGLTRDTWTLMQQVLTQFGPHRGAFTEWFRQNVTVEPIELIFQDTNTDFAIGVEDAAERAVA